MAPKRTSVSCGTTPEPRRLIPFQRQRQNPVAITLEVAGARAIGAGSNPRFLPDAAAVGTSEVGC